MSASADWKTIDFISDLHLADDTPRTFDAFTSYLRHTTADAVFILGDLFEVWVGDDSRHEGFEARCVDVLCETTSRCVLGFMAGNRDFLVGTDMLKACGVLALSDPTVLIAFGERMMLTHGDALCLSDVSYQRFRNVVRGSAWRNDFLSRPLQERRKAARDIREESERRKREQVVGQYFDVDPAIAVRWMHEAGTSSVIHGHTHMPGSEALAPGFQRHVLTDWDFDHCGDHPRGGVLRWRIDGIKRLSPAQINAS
ncbi:MAG: UDP-2,3-diacylglucosamine diphosphatase [Pseudomonadota bacterium]|nr:UDP-2,3-diacylglucosamine diphosphatase [Pseudomonadota bacterium]